MTETIHDKRCKRKAGAVALWRTVARNNRDVEDSLSGATKYRRKRKASDITTVRFRRSDRRDHAPDNPQVHSGDITRKPAAYERDRVGDVARRADTADRHSGDVRQHRMLDDRALCVRSAQPFLAAKSRNVASSLGVNTVPIWRRKGARHAGDVDDPAQRAARMAESSRSVSRPSPRHHGRQTTCDG